MPTEYVLVRTQGQPPRQILRSEWEQERKEQAATKKRAAKSVKNANGSPGEA